MAKRERRIDPGWPAVDPNQHAVSEFNTDRQGSLSPFGDLDFPLESDELPYIHPTTVINR